MNRHTAYVLRQVRIHRFMFDIFDSLLTQWPNDRQWQRLRERERRILGIFVGLLSGRTE